jgi:hypothetical protein
VTLDTILLLAGDGATAVVVAILVARGVFRTFPIFTSYLAWGILSDIVLQFVVAHFYPPSTTTYYNSYLISVIIDSLFQFGVLVEVSWSVLRPLRAALPRWALFAVALLIVLAGAVVWPLVSGPGLSSFSLTGQLVVHVMETFSVLRILFFLVLAGCSQLLSIGWRDRELQIATGLGFYSLVSLAVWIRHSGQAWGPQYHLLDEMVAVSYIGSLAYWLVSFASKEAERREFTPQMQSLLLAMAGTARSTRVALTDSTSDKNRRGRE